MKPISILMVALLACACACVTAAPKQKAETRERTECADDVSTVMAKWSLPTPEGWKCSKIVKDPKLPPSDVPYYVWEKGIKVLTIAKLSMDEIFFPQSKDEVAPDAQEPFKTIRFYTEAYLLDPKLTTPESSLAKTGTWTYDRPKAIFFSSNNEKVLFYRNSGMSLDFLEDGGELRQLVQNADIFMPDNAKYALRVNCHGCTVDEYFSLVVNPLIQN